MKTWHTRITLELKRETTVIPANAGIQLSPTVASPLDYSLRSTCGPPSGRSTRYALLSGLRRNDEAGLEFFDPRFVDVETDGLIVLAEFYCQWQPHVAKAHNAQGEGFVL